MSATELIAEFADWKLFLLALFIYSICPQWVLRLLVLVYDKDDPRRRELLGELYAVPRISRPFWVVEQIETALVDSIWPRFLSTSCVTRMVFRWKLRSGIKLNKKHPASFLIPTAQEKAAVRAGDYVKLVLGLPNGGHARLWVRVTEVAWSGYVGRLVPELVGPAPAWTAGLRFGLKHVIDIMRDNEGAETRCSPELYCHECAEVAQNPSRPEQEGGGTHPHT